MIDINRLVALIEISTPFRNFEVQEYESYLLIKNNDLSISIVKKGNWLECYIIYFIGDSTLNNKTSKFYLNKNLFEHTSMIIPMIVAQLQYINSL